MNRWQNRQADRIGIGSGGQLGPIVPAIECAIGEDDVTRCTRLASRLDPLSDRVEIIIISEEVGFSKPRPQIFRHACNAAGKNPSDCVYVCDKL